MPYALHGAFCGKQKVKSAFCICKRKMIALEAVGLQTEAQCCCGVKLFNARRGYERCQHDSKQYACDNAECCRGAKARFAHYACKSAQECFFKHREEHIRKCCARRCAYRTDKQVFKRERGAHLPCRMADCTQRADVSYITADVVAYRKNYHYDADKYHQHCKGRKERNEQGYDANICFSCKLHSISVVIVSLCGYCFPELFESVLMRGSINKAHIDQLLCLRCIACICSLLRAGFHLLKALCIEHNGVIAHTHAVEKVLVNTCNGKFQSVVMIHFKMYPITYVYTVALGKAEVHIQLSSRNAFISFDKAVFTCDALCAVFVKQGGIVGYLFGRIIDREHCFRRQYHIRDRILRNFIAPIYDIADIVICAHLLYRIGDILLFSLAVIDLVICVYQKACVHKH